jgi:hypothetical protein
MSRARETGFYFEPISERLALVVEGAPFPSDEHWAWIGDPIDVTPELARLEVALRWPGIDPDALHVELDMGMDRLLAELEQQHRQEHEAALPPPAPPDVQGLLDQAQALQAAVAELNVVPVTREELEKRAEELELQRLQRAADAIRAAAAKGSSSD